MAQNRDETRMGAAAEFRAGWKILLGATWGIAVGLASLPFYTAGVLVMPLREAFGWSLSDISLTVLSSTATVALCAPFAGLIVDRFGVVRPAAFGLIALALSFVALGTMSGSYIVYWAISVLTAMLALPSSPISFSRLINGQFDKARGLALGIALSGTGIAAMFAPPIVAAIIAEYGWRTAYYSLAALVVVSLPFVLLLIRKGSLDTTGRTAAPGLPADAPPFRALVRDTRFVRLLLAFFLQALGITGFVLHLVPMLQETGMSAPDAALIQGQMGFAIIAGRILIGLLIDRLFAPRVAAVAVTATVIGVAGFALIGPVFAIPLALTLGFALGAEVDLIGYLTVRYFGLAAYGRIYGLLYGGFVLATGLSPLLIARLHLVRSDYTPALWVCAGFMAIAAILLVTAPRFPASEASDMAVR